MEAVYRAQAKEVDSHDEEEDGDHDVFEEKAAETLVDCHEVFAGIQRGRQSVALGKVARAEAAAVAVQDSHI